MIISELDKKVNDFLEHHGVKGMRWGVRRARFKADVSKLQAQGFSKRKAKRHVRIQLGTIDPLRNVAEGKGAFSEKFKVSMLVPFHQVLRGNLQQEAGKNLERALAAQAKMNAGERSARATLSKFGGYDMRKLNYKYKKPRKQASYDHI